LKKTIFKIFIFLSVSLNAQKHYGEFSLTKNFKKAPYLFDWINVGFAAMQCEVSVDHYCAFLEAVSRDSSAEYIRKILPGEECALFPYIEINNIKVPGIKKVSDPDKERPISWLNEEKFFEDKFMEGKKKVKGVDDEFYNPYNLPITGITYEQAMEYAKWVTSKLNNEFNRYQKEDVLNVMVFRLPNVVEQEELIRLGIEKCNFSGKKITEKEQKSCDERKPYLKSCKNEKGCALCNVSEKDTCASNKMIIEAFGPSALYSVWSFNPSQLGLYNCMGNAAEMSNTKGIAKGGSYLNKAEDCQAAAQIKYDAPQKWLGIRLIAEIREVDGDKIYISNNGTLMFRD
jgi:hypothetical protein